MSKTFWAGPEVKTLFTGTLPQSNVNSASIGPYSEYPSIAFRVSYNGNVLVNQTTNPTSYDYSISQSSSGSTVNFHSSFVSNLNTSDTLIVSVEVVDCIIYNGDYTTLDQFKLLANDPAGTTNPLTYSQKLDSLYFHSGLSYLGGTETATVTVSHPARTAAAANATRKHADTSYNLLEGSQEYTLINHSGDINSPFIVTESNEQLMQGLPIQSVGASVRSVAAYNTGTSIKIFEKYMTHAVNLPAVSKTYTVYVFNFLGNSTDSTENNLKITSTSFNAAGGRLNTDYKYLRKETTSPDFYFSKGKTADLMEGKIKVISPSGKVSFNPVNVAPFWQFRHNGWNLINYQAGGANQLGEAADAYGRVFGGGSATYAGFIYQSSIGYALYRGTFGGVTGGDDDEGTTISSWVSSGNSVGIKI